MNPRVVAHWRSALLALMFAVSYGAVMNTQAVLLYAYNNTGNRLVSFHSSSPGTFVTNIPIAGLGAAEYLVGIDIRPSTGVLYGVVGNLSIVRLVTINPSTGVATSVGTGFSSPSSFYGAAFNLVTDRIQLVSDTGSSVRINPDTGALVATDSSITGATKVVHIAFTKLEGTGSTTLFGIDTGAGNLVRIGGLSGSPSPNGGVATTVAALGITGIADYGGMAIDASTNTAYASIYNAAGSRLYAVNLATGYTTSLGEIGSGTLIDGLVIAPTPNECIDIDGDGIANATTD